MIFSPAGPKTGVIAIIVQSYCILLGVLFCIGRQQLSLFDVNHALLLVTSPPTVCVMLVCTCGLFKLELFHIKSHPRIIYTLGAFLLPLLLGLGLTLRLSSQAFIDSGLCINTDSIFLSTLFIIFHLSIENCNIILFLFVYSFVGARNPRMQEGTSELQGELDISWPWFGDESWGGRYVSIILDA